MVVGGGGESFQDCGSLGFLLKLKRGGKGRLHIHISKSIWRKLSPIRCPDTAAALLCASRLVIADHANALGQSQG